MGIIRRRLKAVVGRAERVDFPDAQVIGVHAKVDTGAYSSSVWASDIREEGGVLYFKLFGSKSKFYSGTECSATQYEVVEVENSFGQKQDRYSVPLRVKLGPKTVKSNFTLADRSTKTYPVLVGRKLLKGRYLVDVSEGDPLESDKED